MLMTGCRFVKIIVMAQTCRISSSMHFKMWKNKTNVKNSRKHFLTLENELLNMSLLDYLYDGSGRIVVQSLTLTSEKAKGNGRKRHGFKICECILPFLSVQRRTCCLGTFRNQIMHSRLSSQPKQ